MKLRIRERAILLLLRGLHGWRGRSPHARPANVDRILLISSTALGDTVLSTPAIQSVRNRYPEAHICLLLHVAYLDLFRAHPGIDEVIPFHGGYRRFWRLAWRLRQGRFDVVCIFHGNEPQTTPLAYLSGAPRIYKLPNDNRYRFLLSNREPVLGWSDLGHGIDQRLAVAELAGAPPTERRMLLPVLEEATYAFAELAASHGIGPLTPLVAFQVGASTRSRRWAPSRYVELAKQLLADYPALHLILTGSPTERSLAEEVAAGISDPRVWVTAGSLPLRLLPAMLQRCQVLVTGDTGPMHVAVAVGTPVVALFAVSDHLRSGPKQDEAKHIVIQKWRTCEPCLSKRCPYAEPICMKNISVEEVGNAVATQLLRHGVSPVSDGAPRHG